MGRPPYPEQASRKSVTLPDSLWDEIADYRHNQRISSEAEALRRIIRAGLDAEALLPKKAARTPKEQDDG
jgi:metal-responsive CopG/Arc/MetJ family transcriptional regulator